MTGTRRIRPLNLVLSLVTMAAFVLVPAGAAIADSHHFNVDVSWNGVWGHEFTPGATVDVTVEGIPAGSFAVDGAGDWGGEFAPGVTPSPGDEIIADDGALAPKSLTLTELMITHADPLTDVVTGTAAVGSSVEVWVDEGPSMAVVADAAGNWLADFGGVYDLQQGTGGSSNQCDADGDCTFASWWIPDPHFTVDPETQWVWGGGWLPDTLITVTIGADTRTGSTNGDGWFDVHFDVVDIGQGSLMEVTDGVSTETHIVTDVNVTAVDEIVDTVTGTTTFAGDVYGWVHGEDMEPVDGVGDPWVIDFSGVFDLVPGSAGAVHQCDDNGNCTNDEWWIPDPHFVVDPQTDNLWGGDWAPNATITATIGGAVSTGSTGPEGWFDVHFSAHDIAPGDLVTVTDGTSTETHTVTGLAITMVDADADTVSGVSAPGAQINVWVHDTDVWREVVAGGGGTWTADFSADFDVVPGTAGASHDCDENGNCTNAEWWVANPHFWINPFGPHIDGGQWAADTIVTVSVAGVPVAWLGTDAMGSFGGPLPLDPPIPAGTLVTADDGVTTRTHEVTALQITDVDPDADTVSGTAAPFSDVEIWVHVPEHVWRLVTADAAGAWTADFSVPGPRDDEQGIADLVPGTDGNSAQCDENRSCTSADWRVPLAVFWIDPGIGDINGNDWTPFASVDVSIEGTYIASYDTNERGEFGGPLPEGAAVGTGFLVEVDDGTWSKSHLVTALEIVDVDIEDDEVTGLAEPGSEVDIWVHDVGDVWRHLVVGSGGWFTAEFADLGAVEGHGTTDLVYGSNGNSSQCDEDGDCTAAFWWVGAESATVEGHVYLDGEPLADVEVWLAPEQFTCTDADGYFLFEDADPTGGMAATGPGLSGLGCGNAAFVDPDTGQPLLVAFHEGFDLYDGYEYLEFNVERAGAVFDVSLEDYAECGWHPVDGAAVYAYERNDDFVDLWGTVPDPADYDAILGWQQPLYGWTGANEADPPGYYNVRLPEATDVFVLVETDRGLVGGIVDAGAFSLVDGYAAAPRLAFEIPLDENPAPCITNVVWPNELIRQWRKGTVAIEFVDAPFDDTHVVEIDWGDGTITTTAADFENGRGSVEVAHKFKKTGFFEVTVTIADGGGGSDTASFAYVIVYNPKDSAKGTGRYRSPEGSIADRPELSTKTKFSFSVYYERLRSTSPSGFFKLRIPKADLAFWARSFDFLVVEGGEARFYGAGRLNGADGYRFLVTVFDAASTRRAWDKDEIRVQIWDDMGNLVYDTQRGDDPLADPTTRITGGWIKVR